MQQSENQPAAIEIALWRYPKKEHDWNRWEQSLSQAERDRATTYRFEGDRASFIAGRYLLRRLLSGSIGTVLGNVVLSPDKYGRLGIADSYLIHRTIAAIMTTAR
jgi:4'-phosphopantetheinyl transferase